MNYVFLSMCRYTFNTVKMYDICNYYEFYEICLKLIRNSRSDSEQLEVVGPVWEALLNRGSATGFLLLYYICYKS